MSKRTLQNGTPQAEAIEAFRDKDEDARRRLSREFIAYIQVPPPVLKRGKKPRKRTYGYMIYATSGETAFFTGDYFSVFMIGSLETQVQTTHAAIQLFCREIRKKLDAMDVQARAVVNMLRMFHKSILEDKNEPRAQVVETLFLEHDCVLWCGYDGAANFRELTKEGNDLILRGCYDDVVRGKVESVIRKYVHQKVPSKLVLNAMVNELQEITGLKQVSFTPFTG